MKLESRRFSRARLADPSHRLPWGGRWFGHGSDEPGFETVDLWNSFHAMLIADGSLKLAPSSGVQLGPDDIAPAF